MTVGTGTLWSFDVWFAGGVHCTYSHGTALDGTHGVCFDTSGNGRHLLFTVTDTSVTCATSLVTGSDYLNQYGWTLGDESQFLEDDVGSQVVPVGALIPALSDLSGACTFSDTTQYLINSSRTVLINGSGDALTVGA
jgi:hypothetical protein